MTVYDQPLCWICGEPVDTSEHRLKKSDIVRAHALIFGVHLVGAPVTLHVTPRLQPSR